MAYWAVAGRTRISRPGEGFLMTLSSNRVAKLAGCLQSSLGSSLSPYDCVVVVPLVRELADRLEGLHIDIQGLRSGRLGFCKVAIDQPLEVVGDAREHFGVYSVLDLVGAKDEGEGRGAQRPGSCQ